MIHYIFSLFFRITQRHWTVNDSIDAIIFQMMMHVFPLYFIFAFVFASYLHFRTFLQMLLHVFHRNLSFTVIAQNQLIGAILFVLLFVLFYNFLRTTYVFTETLFKQTFTFEMLLKLVQFSVPFTTLSLVNAFHLKFIDDFLS